MTKKEIKKQEEYLNNQSAILNESLEFWQTKTLEQVNFCEELDVTDPPDLLFEDEDFDGGSAVRKAAQDELNYCMAKLQWENLQLNKLDNDIKSFLKSKKSK